MKSPDKGTFSINQFIQNFGLKAKVTVYTGISAIAPSSVTEQMKVINLFAPPGTGKTATGQILSGLLSIANFKVEYIPEFAKFMTLSKNESALSDQVYMFGKQENRLNVLNKTNLDFVVMDGPLPLALLFHPDKHYRNFEPLVMEVFDDYDNINFYLKRNPAHAYKEHGRNETFAESQRLDVALRSLLKKHEVKFDEHIVQERLPFVLFQHVTGMPAPMTDMAIYAEDFEIGSVPLELLSE